MTAIVRYNQTPLNLPAVFAQDPFFNRFLKGLHPEIFEVMDSFDHTGGINLYEEGNALIAEVALPGWKKDEIEVSLQEDQLKIVGKQQTQSESPSRKHYHRGMSFQEFTRMLNLPYAVDPKKVKATHDNGILRIAMQKQETNSFQVIPVQ